MKKSLSLFFALVMLISSFSFSFNAFANTKFKNAPKVQLGDTFAVTYTQNKNEEPEYAAKFVAPETRYYEFAFDTKATTEDGFVDVAIYQGQYEWIDSRIFDADSDTAPFIAAKLTKGATYYLVINGYECGTYSSNVKIKKHYHNIKKETYPATKYYMPEYDWNDSENGMVANVCTNCQYNKKLETIYRPKTVKLSKTKYVYDGKSKKPSVTVTDSKGNKIKSSNYTVTYDNATRVGTATATVVFNDKKYAGTVVLSYTINPKATAISSVTAKSKGFNVRWNRVGTQITGYQVQRATDSKFTKNKKTETLSGTFATSKTYDNLKSNKKYYVRVRTYRTVNGKKYYSAWSKYKAVTTRK